MALNGCCTFVKIGMIIINFLFWIIGLFFIISSIWMLTDPTFVLSVSNLTNEYYLYILLAVGCFILIGAFLGCCGAFKESQCLIVSFFCFLLIIMVAQIAAGVWAVHNTDKLELHIRNSVKHSIQNEYGIINVRTIAFDSFQRNLKCCGSGGPQDWAASRYNNIDRSEGLHQELSANQRAASLDISLSNPNSEYTIPESCCNEEVAPDVCDKSRRVKVGGIVNQSVYQKGCIDKILEIYEVHSEIIFIVATIVIILEILAMILALSLCCAIKKNDYKA